MGLRVSARFLQWRVYSVTAHKPDHLDLSQRNKLEYHQLPVMPQSPPTGRECINIKKKWRVEEII